VSLFHRGRAEEKERARDEREQADRGMARVKGMFEDLLNLEINVIITPGMTARKMPDPWNALENTVEAYELLLREFCTEVLRGFRAQGSPRVQVYGEVHEQRARKPDPSMVADNGRLRFVDPAEMTRGPGAPSFATFDHLRVWAMEATAVACALIALPSWPDAEQLNEKVVLFKRIERNCEQLQAILTDPDLPGAVPQPVGKDLVLSAEQLLTVRKIWEVGIATVVMQTVVQLDGDIVTRIHKAHEAASSQPIHELHRQSVDSAVKHWQFLFQTLTQFATAALRR